MSASDEQSSDWRQRAEDSALILTIYEFLREKAAATIQFIAEHQEEIWNFIEALLKIFGFGLIAGLLWEKKLKYLFSSK